MRHRGYYPGRGPPWGSDRPLNLSDHEILMKPPPSKKMGPGDPPQNEETWDPPNGFFSPEVIINSKVSPRKKKWQTTQGHTAKNGLFFESARKFHGLVLPQHFFFVEHVHHPKSHTQTKQNLRTLTPILEVRIPVAKTICGNFANASKSLKTKIILKNKTYLYIPGS